MHLSEVLFIGGIWPKFASVGIRCVDIATYLGCAYVVNVRSLDDLPKGYKAYICVKTKLSDADLTELSTRGIVLWDIVDGIPSKQTYIHSYIASTQVAATDAKHLGAVHVIPHHHCNFGQFFNSSSSRRPAWLGHMQWYPAGLSVDHDRYDVSTMTQEDIVSAYQNTQVGLNLRVATPDAKLHARLSSGIKLINCVGFGIPSISTPEQPYIEIDGDCTLFTGLEEVPEAVARLKADCLLYNRMRDNCMKLAAKYSIAEVAKCYSRLIAQL